MNIFWDQILTFAAVVLAAGYLVVHYIRRKRRKTGCASCPTLKVLRDQHKAGVK